MFSCPKLFHRGIKCSPKPISCCTCYFPGLLRRLSSSSGLGHPRNRTCSIFLFLLHTFGPRLPIKTFPSVLLLGGVLGNHERITFGASASELARGTVFDSAWDRDIRWGYPGAARDGHHGRALHNARWGHQPPHRVPLDVDGDGIEDQDGGPNHLTRDTIIFSGRAMAILRGVSCASKKYIRSEGGGGG